MPQGRLRKGDARLVVAFHQAMEGSVRGGVGIQKYTLLIGLRRIAARRAIADCVLAANLADCFVICQLFSRLLLPSSGHVVPHGFSGSTVHDDVVGVDHEVQVNGHEPSTTYLLGHDLPCLMNDCTLRRGCRLRGGQRSLIGSDWMSWTRSSKSRSRSRNSSRGRKSCNWSGRSGRNYKRRRWRIRWSVLRGTQRQANVFDLLPVLVVPPNVPSIAFLHSSILIFQIFIRKTGMSLTYSLLVRAHEIVTLLDDFHGCSCAKKM